jgi:colanic acid biosynthesis glycosyl transferase WcaI
MTGAKAWLHYQDFEIEAGQGLALLRDGALVRAALGLERRLLRSFDLVSTISPRMLEALERKGAPGERLMLFPNWVDTDRIRPLAAPVALRREFGIDDERCVVLYSGNMGRKQGLESVIEAARLLAGESERPPFFVLAGGGATRASLERAAGALPNVLFLPLQPEARFNEFLNMGDIHLLPQRRAVEDRVMPSKLCGIMAAGKPVVAAVPPDSQVATMLGEAAAIVEPENSAALADAIRALAGDPARRRAMGDAARRVALSVLRSDKVLAGAEARLAALAGA